MAGSAMTGAGRVVIDVWERAGTADSNKVAKRAVFIDPRLRSTAARVTSPHRLNLHAGRSKQPHLIAFRWAEQVGAQLEFRLAQAVFLRCNLEPRPKQIGPGALPAHPA